MERRATAGHDDERILGYRIGVHSAGSDISAPLSSRTLYRISEEDVEATISHPANRATDERGNARLTGKARDGRPILVVVAKDDRTS